MRRDIVITLCTALLLSLIGSISLYREITLLSWANTLFLCSLLLLMVGGTLSVIQNGFFNSMIRSFQHFLRSIDKTTAVLQDIEGKKQPGNLYRRSFRFTFSFLFAGAVLLAISLAISITVTL
ncbi:protein of unknown function [Evansella caseinilytica]|uniref:DUF3899 domain-containing protein n=1 Tax=Evansella caseinilytica TaxID=1503961 RepID=A0A1H3UGT7_9BACI|nr:DUF3899 domain-containing protein [Evansella caseinilytica]SDZ61680.1 protein of unknown function [Evansella caseinilytica]